MSTEQNLITTPLTAEFLRGHLDVEETGHGLLPNRLPAWARRQIPDDLLAVAEAQPSGVRLVFRTSVPRQVVGRFSGSGKLGTSGSAAPVWTSWGRFQARASWGRTVL